MPSTGSASESNVAINAPVMQIIGLVTTALL
jgi:hypothetical protein